MKRFLFFLLFIPFGAAAQDNTRNLTYNSNVRFLDETALGRRAGWQPFMLFAPERLPGVRTVTISGFNNYKHIALGTHEATYVFVLKLNGEGLTDTMHCWSVSEGGRASYRMEVYAYRQNGQMLQLLIYDSDVPNPVVRQVPASMQLTARILNEYADGLFASQTMLSCGKEKADTLQQVRLTYENGKVIKIRNRNFQDGKPENQSDKYQEFDERGRIVLIINQFPIEDLSSTDSARIRYKGKKALLASFMNGASPTVEALEGEDRYELTADNKGRVVRERRRRFALRVGNLSFFSRKTVSKFKYRRSTIMSCFISSSKKTSRAWQEKFRNRMRFDGSGRLLSATSYSGHQLIAQSDYQYE